MDRSAFLRWKADYQVGFWGMAKDLRIDHKAIIIRGRKIAWYADGTFHLTLAGMCSKLVLTQLNFAYSAIVNEAMPKGNARWPGGPAVFFNNKVKHRGELGLHFKDELITAHTVIRVTIPKLITEGEMNEHNPVTPSATQD